MSPFPRSISTIGRRQCHEQWLYELVRRVGCSTFSVDGIVRKPSGRHTQRRYPSPTAVFDAYREVRGKREWRKVFSVLTLEMQNDSVFETFFGCAEHNSKEEQAIVKKYVDSTAANAAFEKKYKERHGIDISEASKGHETDPMYKPPSPDPDLFRELIAAHVKDKAGFVEAVAKLSESNPVCPLGDLENLVLRGDTATGSAKETFLPRIGNTPPPPPGQSPSVYERPFTFRRVNGGWLLDSL